MIAIAMLPIAIEDVETWNAPVMLDIQASLTKQQMLNIRLSYKKLFAPTSSHHSMWAHLLFIQHSPLKADASFKRQFANELSMT
jgi:hypothetical protein